MNGAFLGVLVLLVALPACSGNGVADGDGPLIIATTGVVGDLVSRARPCPETGAGWVGGPIGTTHQAARPSG